MSEEYLETITPEIVEEPKSNTNTIIIAVIAVIVLCCCICLCVFFVLPTIFGPAIGDVFSDVIDEMMLTPMP
jgi:hypothetical protein